MEPRAAEIIQRQAFLKSGRGIWERHWQEIGERILPHAAQFTAQWTTGAKRNEKVFDATACLALDRYASAVESLIMPRQSIWHKLVPLDDELADNVEVKQWCESLNTLLWRLRYDPAANFAGQAHEAIITLGAFGTAGLFVDDGLNYESRTAQNSVMVYRSLNLDSMFIDENHLGLVDTVHKVFTLKGRQAMQKFGPSCPQKIIDEAKVSGTRDWEFIHCVAPSSDPSKTAGDWSSTDKPIWSTYVSKDLGEVVLEGGYNTMPMCVSRNITAPREVYGRSVAMIVLPDIKMVNEMSKTVIRAGHRVVDPPLLLSDDGSGPPFDARAGALNYGHVDAQGRQLTHPMVTGANIPLGEEMLEQRRKVINDAFLITLFQILVRDREMTAYEAALRAQEKGQLLAPTMGRQESELLGPMIRRELDILWTRGIIQRELPPMPQALINSGGRLKVRYTSPMARLAMQEQAVGIQSAFQQIAPLVQIAPSAVDRLDIDALTQIILDANGVPEKARRTDEQMQAVREQKQQAANQQQILAAAPVAAQAAKDATQAQANAASVPSQQPATIQ